MKLIDERATQKKKKKYIEEQRRAEAIVKEWKLNDFVVHLN